MNLLNPVGTKIRNDAGGSGHYGARRSKKLPDGRIKRYAHKGTDYKCKPGQDIKAPCIGIMTRSRPYAHSEYNGVRIDGKRLSLQIFYVEPDKALLGKPVMRGQIIGKAQDISKRYASVTPHVHVQICQCDPEIFMKEDDINFW